MAVPTPWMDDAQSQPWSRRDWLLASVAAVGGVAAVLAPSFRKERPRARGLSLLEAEGAALHDSELTAAQLDAPLEQRGGTKTSLRSLVGSGEVLLVHFWASWCPPCIEELPALAQMTELLADRQLQLVAVDYDDDWSAADAMLQRAVGTATPAHGVWLRDPQGQSGNDAAMLRAAFGTDKLPETWVVADGRVVAHLVAGQPWTETRMLRALQLLAPRRAQARSAT